MQDIQLIKTSDYFDQESYQKKHLKEAKKELASAEHFCTEGWLKGFPPSHRFSTTWYLENYPDVKISGINPLVHFLRHGKKEGRLPRSLKAIEFEKQLWESTDHVDSTIKKLVQLSAHDCNAETLYSKWALTRWYASQGQWQVALPFAKTFQKAIQSDDFQEAREDFLAHDGPFILIFCVLLQCGDTANARKLLDKLQTTLKHQPDLALMQCSLEQSDPNNKLDGLSGLVRLYRSNTLLVPDYKNLNSDFNLDNLTTKSSRIDQCSEQSLVTVIVPVYNAEETLPTAIESLINQTYQNLEILIIDDCSTDGSLKLAQLFSEQETRVKVIQHHCNQGAYAARNTGLRVARGDYITTHDSDDWSHCQKIELQVKAFRNSPEIKATTSHWARCSTDLVFGTWRQESSWVHRNVSSLLFHRTVFETLGYWDRVSINADTEYYYRIASEYGADSLHEVLSGIPLSFGRWSENSLTGSTKTHWRTQFGGIRKDYMDTAHNWHEKAKKDGSLYMAFNPEHRAFTAPESIQRPGLYFGKESYPVHQGSQSVCSERPTVLLCAHAAGKTLFGAERSFLDLAKAINQNNYRLIITLPEASSPEYLEALKVFASFIIVMPYFWWHEKRPVNTEIVDRFKTLIQKYNVNLLHANTLVLREPLLAAKEAGIPGLMHVRELPELDHDLCRALGTKSERIRINISEWADGFIVNSLCTSRFVAAEERSQLLYNTVDKCTTPYSPGDDKVVRFALISSNIPKKGIDDFIRLARRAENTIKNAQFILIGPENEHTEALLNCRKKPTNLIYHGYTRTPKEAIENADIVLNLSSFQESFGRTIAEAMASGRAVIGYRWGAIPELIDNGRNGYLVHLGDIDGLLKRVELLTRCSEHRRALGLAGIQKVSEFFSFSLFCQQLDSIYSSWIDNDHYSPDLNSIPVSD
ncbi:glycosyltransferase [Endozoicomonas numazuensis]|uniref:glycosyltransferase n=1 Tax=Endozoicomonas numazuensis TaxID=1137799 RepID=UPI0006897AD9|nr:glycosyltransferase [Endozoicomonas numazuensis]